MGTHGAGTRSLLVSVRLDVALIAHGRGRAAGLRVRCLRRAALLVRPGSLPTAGPVLTPLVLPMSGWTVLAVTAVRPAAAGPTAVPAVLRRGVGCTPVAG